jgi:hypothetical protein
MRRSRIFIPFGAEVEYKPANSVSLNTHLLFNFTDLDVRYKKFFFI